MNAQTTTQTNAQMMRTHSMFPTPLYAWNIPNSPVINSMLEQQAVEMSNNTEGIIKSNVKGWHSETDIHTKPENKEIFDIIESCLSNIFTSRGVNDSVLFVSNAWFNINQKGAFNQMHSHPWSFFSGVYYIKTPKNCGHLIFEDPRPVEVHNPFPDFKFPTVSIEPVAGTLFIFPSYLPHKVEPNESDENRISISFNASFRKIKS